MAVAGGASPVRGAAPSTVGDAVEGEGAEGQQREHEESAAGPAERRPAARIVGAGIGFGHEPAGRGATEGHADGAGDGPSSPRATASRRRTA
jgi:hypothetical protein